MERVVLDAVPSMTPLLVSSLARDGVRRMVKRRPRSLPDREVVLADVTQSVSRLAAYDNVCGFGVRDLVPATWLHVQTFPLQLVLLSAPDSPFSLAGMVHVTNSMTLMRPVSVGERLTLSSSYGPPREHRRGVLIHTSALGGKAFGFPRAIIQGMWTHARVLAALEPRLPDTYRMDVRFTKPVLLPSSVRFGARRDGDHWTAVVRPRSGEKTHLVARVTQP